MDSGSVATAAEDARPSLGSNGGETPSTDDGQQRPHTRTHQTEAANVAPENNNDRGPEENAIGYDAVSAGQNATATLDSGPSHDSNGNASSTGDGQQEPHTGIHQSGAAGIAPETSIDHETEADVIQSAFPGISQNMAETESAGRSVSAVTGMDFGLVDGTHIVNMPITSDEQSSQSDRGIPSQAETERNVGPGPEQAPGADAAANLESNSNPDPGAVPESEENDEATETYKVRLAQMSLDNLEPSEIEKNQALGQAIVDGKLETFNRLLKEGARIESRYDDEEVDGDPDQSTLFLAARHDWPKIAEKILELKSDKDFLEDTKTNGWTPAHIAAQNDSVDVLRQILEAGEKLGIKLDIVNSRNRDKSTPLLLAAREDCLEIVKMLLDNGADLTIESDSEGTPLHSAAYHGSKKVFTHLLGVEGAKDLIGKQDDDGWSVLHSAARGGVEITSLLDDKSILKVLTKRTQSTALLIAALNGHKDIVISLLEAGSEMLAKTNDGRTVLHMAAESGSVETLEELAGRLDRDTIISKDDKGGTALCSAAMEHNFDAVCFFMGHEAFSLPRLKLGSSAKVNHRDIQEVKKFFLDFFDKPANELDSLTHWPLIVHWAVFYGWESIVKTCFNRKGDLCDLKTKSGETLLHVAACNGHAGVVELLIDCFRKRGTTESNIMAKVSDKTNDGIIPLHFAAANDYVRTVRRLLEGSNTEQFVAKYNKTNDETLLYLASRKQILVETRNGETALYFAARNGHESVVSFLLRWLDNYSDLQVTIRKKTADGKTPLSEAADNGHQGAAKALLKVLTKDDFKGDPEVAWDELTEVARTGLEYYVELIVAKKILRQSIPGNNPEDLFPDQKWTGLLWAVYYGHYKVVWWLLRRNGPTILTSPIFEDATDMVDILLTKLADTTGLTPEEKSEKEQRYREIKDCLYSPPRVENVYDQFDPDGTPSVPQLSEKKERVCEKYRATIVDFYNKADHISFAALSRTMLETLYDKNLSLDEIMSGAGTDRQGPKLLNKDSGVATGSAPSQPGATDAEAPDGALATGQPIPEALASGTQKHAVATRQEQSAKKKQVRDEGYRFRWIHVPANNVSESSVPML